MIEALGEGVDCMGRGEGMGEDGLVEGWLEDDISVVLVELLGSDLNRSLFDVNGASVGFTIGSLALGTLTLEIGGTLGGE